MASLFKANYKVFLAGYRNALGLKPAITRVQ